MFKTYLICCGLGYLVVLPVAATALIHAAIVHVAERYSLPRLLTVILKCANGFVTFGALFAWGSLVGPFLRSGGDTYRIPCAAAGFIGLGVVLFGIRELDRLRKAK